MQQMFVWTFGDVVGVVAAVVVAATFATIALKQWVTSAICKHDGAVDETMACDAICRKCGKNLGFIGAWRDAHKSAHCMCDACKDGDLHYSDCAVHNAPAIPRGSCDCGAVHNAELT
jgi:hypothetical protein